MPGDYSRKLFNSKKHYSAVLQQQGRVQLDADWNEQSDIQQHQNKLMAYDLAGKLGVPKKNGGFKLTANAEKTDILISPGRIYLEGKIFECEENPVASYLHQPHYTNPPKSVFNDSDDANPNSSTLKDGNYIAYLEAWQREINYLDDPSIQEVALGEADTTTRLQNIWQLKLLPINLTGTITCKSEIPDWNNLTAFTTGKLNARVNAETDTTKPCMLPPGGGYTSLDNQLYRIQIIHGGALSEASFAWSRDNASVETAIMNISGSVLTVSDMGKDEVLGFSGGQWVEIIEPQPGGAQPKLYEILTVHPELKQIELNTSVNEFSGKPGLKLRRWDITENGTEKGIPLNSTWVELENGIQILFSDGTYRSGDYWLIPARTATAAIEWPTDTDLNSIPQLPLGIERYFAKLGIIKSENGTITIKDCRPTFPSLTDICAEDICYSNSGCSESTATNVQEALDELCHKRDGACTYIAYPGKGWEKVFDKIGAGKDAQICFQTGSYPLTEPVKISGKGHLKLSGAGLGTRIAIAGFEEALNFENCKSVFIRDLHAETTSFINNPAKLTKHLNGVLTLLNCPLVKLNSLSIQCGAAAKKQAGCITIRNNPDITSSATINDCDLSIGYFQHGILLVNAKKIMIENNRLSANTSDNRFTKQSFLSNKRYISGFRSAFMTKAGEKNLKDESGMSVVTFNHAGQSISFLTPIQLKNDWNRIFRENLPENIFSSNDLLNHIKKLTDKIIYDKEFTESIATFRAFRRAILSNTRTIASEGITVSGTVAEDVKVINNNIEDSLIGIHVGLSHKAARNIHDRAESVIINGNTIQVTLPGDAGRIERHGIFVGNCRSLCIEDNQIYLQRLSGAERTSVEGIKVFGLLGERLMVNKNLVCNKEGVKSNSFSTGISIQPIATKTNLQQWMAMYNVAPSKGNSVVVKNGVTTLNNTP